MEVYEKDPEAEAVVLFDIGQSEFVHSDQGMEIKFVRSKRIKILSLAGLDYAEVSIPFYVDGYGKTEQVVDIKAMTYNLENGMIKRTPLDVSTVYEEQFNNRIYRKKFTFPNVQEGSIIEFQYELHSPFHFNLPDWEFQGKIPTLYSSYTAKMIPFYEYIFILKGTNKFTEQYSSVDKNIERTFAGVQFKDMVYTFIMRDVQAFRDEAYITAPSDYMIQLDFQLAKINFPTGGSSEIMSTWPKLIDELQKHEDFGKSIKKNRKIAETVLVTSLDLAGKTDEEKSQLIIDYVKNTFSWDEYYSKYASKSAKRFVDEKSGNAGDINLFLIAMLQAAGIDAVPVIISTRNHGKLTGEYPFISFFNYVIALVRLPGHSFLTDGTDPMIAYNKLPVRCMNDKGLVIEEGEEVHWVELYNTITSLEKNTIKINLDAATLSANVQLSTQTTEFEAYQLRNRFRNDSVKIRDSFLSGGFSSIDRVKTMNFDQIDQPYTLALSGTVPIESIDGKLLISPFLNLPESENQLKQTTRNYPVDFIFQKTHTYTSEVLLPDGYQFAFIPEAYKLNNDLMEISYSAIRKENVLVVEATAAFKKAIYQPSEYARIRSYFTTIVRKFNEQIVITRP